MKEVVIMYICALPSKSIICGKNNYYYDELLQIKNFLILKKPVE